LRPFSRKQLHLNLMTARPFVPVPAVLWEGEIKSALNGEFYDGAWIKRKSWANLAISVIAEGLQSH
jgi:hypothetical protein